MPKEKIILLVAVLALVIGIINLVILGVLFQKAGESDNDSESFNWSVSKESGDWQNPKEPMSSQPLEEKDIPKEAIKIEATAKGFSPSSFEVKKGREIILVVTGQDEWTHVFAFKDEKLAEVKIGVGPGEIRAITFYAPEQVGEYEFICDVPGHAIRGEKGIMIVK